MSILETCVSDVYESGENELQLCFLLRMFSGPACVVCVACGSLVTVPRPSQEGGGQRCLFTALSGLLKCLSSRRFPQASVVRASGRDCAFCVSHSRGILWDRGLDRPGMVLFCLMP